MKDLLAEAYLRTRSSRPLPAAARTRPFRRMAAFLDDVEGCFLMLSKELIQVANRPRFHVEKAILTAFLSGALVVTIFGVAGTRTVSIQNVDSFGREAFTVLSMLGWAALSLAASAPRPVSSLPRPWASASTYCASRLSPSRPSSSARASP